MRGGARLHRAAPARPGKEGAGGAAAAGRRERRGGACQAVTAGGRGGGAFHSDTAVVGVGRV